ncbi:MAG: hypothetical protein CSB06_03230 [Bacteroidia bacterium]|nr:MAG: hypothetical protein CSB06_03230 [Bacteroidia bacterium]
MKIPRKYKFIVELGKALHVCGVPSYKTESYLCDIARKKGIKGSFMDTPTWVNFVFYEDEEEHSYTYTECIPPGEINLGALSKVVEITNKVLDNTLSLEEACGEIKRMDYRNFGYGNRLEFLAFVVSAGGFSLIINPNWASAWAASFAGMVIFLFTLWADKSPYVKSTLETLSSFVSTLLIGALASFFPQIHISLTVLSSIIIFIPGLSLTTALEEITSRNLVSGTAKLFDAVISLFKQFFGVMLGLAILPFLVDIRFVPSVHNIPSFGVYIAIVFLALSLIVLFKIRPKDIVLSVLTGCISFYTLILLEDLGVLLSIFIGTVITAAASKFFSYLTKTPRLVYLIPGTVMLVPGSKAFIGLSNLFLKQEPVNIVYYNMGEQVLYIFMGIIGGLIFSGSFMKKQEKE